MYFEFLKIFRALNSQKMVTFMYEFIPDWMETIPIQNEFTPHMNEFIHSQVFRYCEISHNMKNVHKISENIGKKAFISLKFIKNKQNLHY